MYHYESKYILIVEKGSPFNSPLNKEGCRLAALRCVAAGGQGDQRALNVLRKIQLV